MHVVITGASRGLGKAIAEKFAEAGHDLYLTARQDLTLYQSMKDLSARYPSARIHAKAFDLADPQGAKACGQWVLDFGNPVDLLVNNAGHFLPGNIADESDGTLQQMLDANLFSAYHLTRKILPIMMACKRGHIVNMCSIASLQAYPQGGSYSISKFALAGFSKNLREELKAHGIKVTAVYPGATYTDSWAGSGIDPARIMEAQDIAGMVFAAVQLSAQATVEDIVLRPQAGDL